METTGSRISLGYVRAHEERRCTPSCLLLHKPPAADAGWTFLQAPAVSRRTMRSLFAQKSLLTDQPVLLLIFLFNSAALAKMRLHAETLIGAVNGSLACCLLLLSILRPKMYAQHRTVPIVVLRLLVCALPLVSDTISPFGRVQSNRNTLWLLGHACFMLLVGISWSVGLFMASFLLLEPALHVVVHALSLAVLLTNNRSVCQQFLEQQDTDGVVIDGLGAALRALVTSAAPLAQQELDGSLSAAHAGRMINCMAGSTAMQVALGCVLPTLLVWQLQSGMAASIAAHAAARLDTLLAAQVSESQQARLATAVARSAQGCVWLCTVSSLILTFCLCLRFLN